MSGSHAEFPRQSPRSALAAAALLLALLEPGGAAAQERRAAGTAGGPAADDIAGAAPFDREGFARTFRHERAAAADGVTLHYVTGGRGPPLVLLHGFPQSWYTWRRVMPALAERYTVIAPDLRGFGESSKPSSGYDKATVAGDVRRLIRGLGHERVLLVGQDWGGPAAWSLAAAHPGMVERLVNIEGIVPGTVPLDGEAFFQGRGAWWFPFHNAPDGVAEMLVAGRERQYLSHMIRSLMHDPSRVSEADIDEYARTYAGPGGAHAGFEYYRTMPQDMARARAAMGARLTMPVLAVGGGASPVGGQGVVDSMRTLAMDVRGVVLPGCGHYLAEECPAALLGVLLPFLSGEPQPPGDGVAR